MTRQATQPLQDVHAAPTPQARLGEWAMRALRDGTYPSDSPIMPDVWAAFGALAGATPLKLIVEYNDRGTYTVPHRETFAGFMNGLYLTALDGTVRRVSLNRMVTHA